jgi:hypothetical protein
MAAALNGRDLHAFALQLAAKRRRDAGDETAGSRPYANRR